MTPSPRDKHEFVHFEGRAGRGCLDVVVMHALRHQILPPSGVEFATSLRLTPFTIGPTSPRHEFAARALCNVVVARSNLIRIFEVREEPTQIKSQAGDECEGKSKTRKGTEPVEGEVRLFLVKEHHLHGHVTGLATVKTVASYEDHLDRLLVSFKDAKVGHNEFHTVKCQQNVS